VAFIHAEMPLSMTLFENRDRYRGIVETEKEKRVRIDKGDALAINRVSFLHIDIKIANRYVLHDMAGIFIDYLLTYPQSG
jgi:hypothetical protein